MEETTIPETTVAEEGSFNVDDVLGIATDVLGFFKKIVDFLKDLIKPLFTSLFESILG